MKRAEGEAILESVWRLTGDQKLVWQTATRPGFPHGAKCPACEGSGEVLGDDLEDGRVVGCSTCEWSGKLWGDPQQPNLRFEDDTNGPD